MNLTLQLHPAPKPHGETALPEAWFLGGACAERWLEELAHAGLAEASTRLFVVPRSQSEHTAVGLLVLPAVPCSPHRVPAGLACRRSGARLLLPLEAHLEPPVTEAESRQLCSSEITFFHPAFGVSGYAPEDALRVWDLLERPDERVEQWNGARA